MFASVVFPRLASLLQGVRGPVVPVKKAFVAVAENTCRRHFARFLKSKKEEGTYDCLRFDTKNHKLLFCNEDIPSEVETDEVLIKVAYAGISRQDLSIVNGQYTANVNQPTVLGREISGTAWLVGEDVRHVCPGDSVAVDPTSGCGTCDFCTRGFYHYCEARRLTTALGINADGGWAEYCVVPGKQVHKVPAGVDLSLAVLADALSSVSHGRDRLMPLLPQSRALVLGAGAAGLLYTCLLHHHGTRRIVVSEPNEARRRMVQELKLPGVEVVDPADLKVRSGQSDWGMEVVIDCCAQPKAMEEAIDFLQPCGRLLLYGTPAPDAQLTVSPRSLFDRELAIVGTVANPFSFREALNLLRFMGDKYLNYQKLGVKVYPLHECVEAIEALRKREITKAVFEFDDTDV